MQEINNENISAKHIKHIRWLFWLVLSCASVFFAESSGGSFPFALVFPWGIFILVPLYGLHIVLLSSLCFMRGEPRYSVLYSAGAIVGLYEAYVTKMLWQHTWGGAQNHVFGISGTAFVVLVVFWHPLMAFIVPLLWTRAVCCGSKASSRLRFIGWPVIIFAVLSGLGQAAIVPSHAAPLGTLLSGLILVGLILYWKKMSRDVSISFEELLPRGQEVVVLGGYLLLIFMLFGFGMRPEALPGFGPQLAIWVCYAFYAALLLRNLRLSRPTTQPDSTPAPVKGLLTFVMTAPIVSALVLFLLPAAKPVCLGVMIFSLAIFGGYSNWNTLKDTVKGDSSRIDLPHIPS